MIWSARSNVGGIEAETCPTYALVYFETLPIRDLPPDEGHTGSVGPIYGEFWAEGGGERGSLVFDFHSCRRMVEDRCTGVYFVDDPSAPASGNRIWDDFFCAVHRRQAEAPHCPILQSFTVPDTNVVVVALMPGDDLTIGGRIMDYDSDDGDDALFNAQLTLEPDEITEGEHMISDGISRLGIRLSLVAVPIVGGPFSCD